MAYTLTLFILSCKYILAEQIGRTNVRERKSKPLKQKARKVDFASTARELNLAYGRVDSVPTRRLKWLLDFASLDLNTLSEGRLADLRWEVVVFGLNRELEQLGDEQELFFDLGTLRSPLFPPKSPEAMIAEVNKGASLDLMREFQRTMHTAFDTLFDGEQWRVARPTREEGIALPIRTKTGARWAQNPPAYLGHDILLMQAIDLIKAEKDRLKICDNNKCKRRFVAAKRTRARFCSSKCSAWVRVNKARGKL